MVKSTLIKRMKMDKANILNTYVDQLRNTECSQKEKVSCFQHIAECITSPALAAHINYATNCSTATNVLLLFCEDLDAVVRMSAEENLNKIFRVLEKTRVSRILLDLYGEIKRNGNQRSLRICLNLFSYYAPQMREKQTKNFALRLVPCMQVIAQRKETQLCETLCEFVKSFGKYLQQGLTDSETCKLFEVFMSNIGAECAVKRRCSAQNCISLIENARNKSLMARHGLDKVIELLLTDQQNHSVLGALGFLRLLLPLIIRGFVHDCHDDDSDYEVDDDEGPPESGIVDSHNKGESGRPHGAVTATAKGGGAAAAPRMTAISCECRQIIEIYDYCLHLLSASNASSNHATINAALEVINAVLQALDASSPGGGGEGGAANAAKSLQQLLSNQQLLHNEYLRRRKSLKNQIFQLKNYQTIPPAATTTNTTITTTTMTTITRVEDAGSRRATGAEADGAGVEIIKISGDEEQSPSVQGARKLGMRKIANVQREQHRDAGVSLSPLPSLAPALGLRVACGAASPNGAGGAGVGAGAGAVAVDVAADNDVEEDADVGFQSTRSACSHRQPRIRYSARSISECVGDDVDIAGLQLASHIDDDDDDDDEDDADDDDDDFTTFSEINEPRQTGIDVDDLIDAMVASGITGTATATIGSGGPPQQGSAAAVGDTQQAGEHLLNVDDAVTGDDKSQVLSDIDNESFNSIDFDAEITIGGVAAFGGGGGGGGDAHDADGSTAAAASDAGKSSSSNSDTIGSFFNNLISHSNAASESVSKLFRQSSTTKSTPTKSSTVGQADRADALSTASLSGAETMSYASTTSSGRREVYAERQQSTISASNEDTHSSSASVTASTALMVDTSTRNTPVDCSSEEAVGEPRQAGEAADMEFRRTPHVNPFLTEHSPLKQADLGAAPMTLKIGSIHEQSMLHYSARFIAASFLLSGQVGVLQPDAAIRVSIKSLSLSVVAQCVRLAPEVLLLPLEITVGVPPKTSSKESSSSGSPTQARSNSSNSSTVGRDYEHLDAADGTGDLVDFVRRSPLFPRTRPASLLPDELPLLEIKDDHFGKSTCDYFLNEPLSRSADPVLFSRQLGGGSTAAVRPRPSQPSRGPTGRDATLQPLSKSEIIASPRGERAEVGGFVITEAAEDAPPSMTPPRPPKRTKSVRKAMLMEAAGTQQPPAKPAEQQQRMADLLLYFRHPDPMLRGGVQQIIGNFLQASGAGATLLPPELQLDLQQLLAILLKGLEDDIHTVVIQALNAFDKIFPHVVSKYLTQPACHYQQQQQQAILQRQQQQPQQQHTQQQQTQQQQTIGKQPETSTSAETPRKRQDTPAGRQDAATRPCANDRPSPGQACLRTSAPTTAPARTLFTDNDELIAALLNDFQLQSKCNDNNDPAAYTPPGRAAATVGGGGSGDCASTSSSSDGDSGSAGRGPAIFISPKLLLDKLRLCHHNKYWLVQNKYAEVISNLNYAALRAYYATGSSPTANNHFFADAGNQAGTGPAPAAALGAASGSSESSESDVVCTYERLFLDELLQLLGDDDIRVREHAAHCLGRYIMQNASQRRLEREEAPSAADETYQTNFNLLCDFFDYRLFSGMSAPLRDLFRANASIAPPLTDAPTPSAASGCASTPPSESSNAATYGNAAGNGHAFAEYAVRRRVALEEEVLAKVLYRMTNKLIVLSDKNLQFGIIYATKLLLRHFNFVDYRRAWCEFNFMEICQKFCYYNQATAVDLNCQNDLIDLTARLMAGHMLISSDIQAHQQQLDQLLSHTLKMLNIYYHLFGNQKPLLLSKGPPKTDFFVNAKELAIVQSVGYFGGDYVYIKLYNTLRSANDSYKITINQDSGGILIALLKTCLNTLGLCLELRTHTATTAAPTTTTTTTTSTTAAPSTTSSGAASDAAAAAFPSSAVLKLIQEILQYLTKLINYAPGECIACLRQLLKYLFAQNYGNRQADIYAAFVQPYIEARSRGQRGRRGSRVAAQDDGATCSPWTINSQAAGVGTASATMSEPTGNLIATHGNYGDTSSVGDDADDVDADYRLFGELFASALNVAAWKSEREGECAKHIKLFEPLVIFCLPLFLKSNAKVQGPILELLSQLLDLNVTYSVLDSKNVIFDQIINNLDLIESGIVRNGPTIVPPMMRFLVQLTHKSDRQLISIPKIISIANNLLATNAIRPCALLALKALAYELFFMASPTLEPRPIQMPATTRAPFQSPVTRSPLQQRRHDAEEVASAVALAEELLAHSRELDTQREVVLGMLEKFIDGVACRRVLGLLLLRERSAQQVEDGAKAVGRNGLQPTLLQDPNAVYASVCRAVCEGRVRVDAWSDYFVLDACFRNNGKNVLADSKDFVSLLQLLIAKDVSNFSNLSCATTILANVIQKSEEIYLVNHIKLYLKNHATPEQRGAEQERQRRQQDSSSGWSSHADDDAPSTSSAAAARAASASPASSSPFALGGISEINYFAKVLCEKLERCLDCCLLLDDGWAHDAPYCGMAVRFVRALHDVCCRSQHKDALQSVFRRLLAESEIRGKYDNLLMMNAAMITPKSTTTPTPTPTPTPAPAPAPTAARHATSVVVGEGPGAVVQLQVEVCKLLTAMKLLDPLTQLRQIQTVDVKWNVQRTLLRAVCQLNPNAVNWNLQQVRQLFEAAAFLPILIAEHFAFVCNLCEVDEEFCSLLQSALLQHAHTLKQHSIRAVLRLVWHVCAANEQRRRCSVQCTAQFLQLLAKLHRLHDHNAPGARLLQLQLERLARRLIETCGAATDRNAVYDCFIRGVEQTGSEQLQFLLLNELENVHMTTTEAAPEHNAAHEARIIDEKWLFGQLIQFSTRRDYGGRQLALILLEIQSESKLQKIFGDARFDAPRVLRHAIVSSVTAMLATFRSRCVQHNPHISYMQTNPLLRVACAVLMQRIEAIVAGGAPTTVDDAAVSVADAVVMLVQCVRRLEASALVHIEAKLVERFVREHLLRPPHVAILLHFLDWCQRVAIPLLQNRLEPGTARRLLRCIDALLQQQLVWRKLNAPLDSGSGGDAGDWTLRRRRRLLARLLDVVVLASAQSMQCTGFYRRYRMQMVEADAFALMCAFGAASASTWNSASSDAGRDEDEAGPEDDVASAPKAIFIAKLIETKIDIDAASSGGAGSTNGSTAGAGGVPAGSAEDFETGMRLEGATIPLSLVVSIGISLLRTSPFYAFAVTPFEIMQVQQYQQQQQQLQQQQQQQRPRPAHPNESLGRGALSSAPSMTTSVASGKLPTIPVESLSDVDVLRKFVKRLSIFGFTTRQHFEEYFMTFLLLINKVYDANMVDEQEQFQIKCTCLEAILELLITYKTFPIVGNQQLSQFHHTTRWSRINCDTISLRKLHAVQLLISDSNVFSHPNLERQLAATSMIDSCSGGDGADGVDSVIGTWRFSTNQFDLNFMWRQMEAYAQHPATHAADSAIGRGGGDAGDSGSTEPLAGNSKDSASATRGEETAVRNYRYFAAQSGVDFKSSAQLIFDVLTQLVEHNLILVLPNLVKFCEICESRDQIKWIKERALKLQDTISMNDTISHQHLIYLVCKTQALLIPTLGELQQLCTLIGHYLKSSHVFIRNATLAGLLSLLECCSKTNATIGKMSEELMLLRDLIVGYINRHGIIDESPMQCSDTHTKLVWTLNYCLIEWTSKFVPQCHLLSNTIIAAGNFLRKTRNEHVYLCILHGLERMVVISSSGSSSSRRGSRRGSRSGGGAATGSAAASAAAGLHGVVTPALRNKIEKLALDLVKLENEKFSIPALKLLLSCMYVGSAEQLENTELSNGIVQDDAEIIAQQSDKVDILLHCIKSSTRDAAWIYGRVLCQIIRDLVPPNEILTKVIKEFLAINQPHCDVIAMIVFQVFRSAIDSSFLQMLQDWLICSLPTFLALPSQKAVWGLSVIFLSASINLHLIKLFPVVLGARAFRKLGQHEITLFVTAAHDFHAKLSGEQRMRFRDAFKTVGQNDIYAHMLRSL